MEVCRLRDTPIMTFINKLDREGRSPIELLDEVESVLGIACAPLTWPIGMGKRLKGVYHRSEEHTSELQSLMCISYAVFCLKKKQTTLNKNQNLYKHIITTLSLLRNEPTDSSITL